jgi:hypothetical protein
MALLPSEVLRLKIELGWNALSIGAEPYIAITSLFDGVIVPNLTAGAITTSTTTVTASSPPALTTLTLASVAGFDAGARVVIDVDSAQEVVTVESISGSTISALLSKAHSGVYNLTVEGGESFVREFLARIRDVKAQMATAFGKGTLKQVDEIQFYGIGDNQTLFGALGEQLMWWRDELAAALGVRSMWRYRESGNRALSVY